MKELFLTLIVRPLMVLTYLAGIIFYPLVVLVKWLYRRLTVQKVTPTHGDAAFASMEELKERGHLDPRGYLLGLQEGKHVHAYRENSVVLIAPRRTGKSQTLLAGLKGIERIAEPERPHLLIGDPAGELYDRSHKQLLAQGYQCMVIDLVEPGKGAKYDPLGFIDPSRPFDLDRDIKALSELIAPSEPGTRNPHFAEYAQSLIRGVLTVEVKYQGNQGTLSECMDMLLDDKERQNLMKRMKVFKDPAATRALAIFEKMGTSNEGVSMLSTALRKVEPWSMAAVKEVARYVRTDPTDKSRGWTFERMFANPKPVAMFIRTGLGTGGAEFSRLIYGNAINTVRRQWNHTGKPLQRPLRIIVDEARTVGNCNAFMDANNELGKAGVTLFLCFLSIKDVRDTYPQADTLLNGCDWLVFGGGKELSYYREVSELIGDRTAKSLGESESDSGESVSKHEIARRLVKPDELRTLPYSKCVAVIGDSAALLEKAFRRTANGIDLL
jgi:type IV secretion system protein VirD4